MKRLSNARVWAPLAALAAWVVLSAGCRSQPPQPPAPQAPALNFTQELPPGQKALRKIPPGMYPTFAPGPADRAALTRSIDNSLAYLAKPSSEKFFPYLDITHERAVATLRALREILASDSEGSGSFDAAIRANFDVYQSVGAAVADGSGYSGQVLFTGYFTPTYDASLTRTGPYQWPLYKRPADLVTDYEGEGSGRRDAEGKLAPYYTRQQIESGQVSALRGQELVWLKSRWEAYVITVQGSARLRLTDGRIYEVGYAGTNGHPYVSPGRQMLADGVITREQLTLAGLGGYFRAHPEAVDKYLWLNPRTTFLAERPGGPFGKLNVPVTPLATVATDKEVYPRAMPAFVVLSGAIGRGFMMDQDAGGAIRAAGRCDIYMGVGESAEQSAGQQLSTGQLYYVAVKPELVRQYAGKADDELRDVIPPLKSQPAAPSPSRPPARPPTRNGY